MAQYSAEQIRIIKQAMALGRAAMQRSRRYEALIFAEAYVAHGGVQIPGAEGDEVARARIADRLLESLRSGHTGTADQHVLREIKRVQAEVRWARLAESDQVVGFHLRLGPAAQLEMACRELLHQDHGLGAAVFPKAQTVVVPVGCEDYEFTPVLEHELEQ
jgi:hypothetical protein